MVICSTAFITLGRSQLKALGGADLPIAVMPHPFGVRTRAEVRALVEGAMYVDDRLREIIDELDPDLVVEELDAGGAGEQIWLQPIHHISAQDLSAQLGELLFNDASLSASGRMACSTCHDPARGHADPAGGFLPLGGPSLDQQGRRAEKERMHLTCEVFIRIDPDGNVDSSHIQESSGNEQFDRARPDTIAQKVDG